jgi:hypothetical protein
MKHEDALEILKTLGIAVDVHDDPATTLESLPPPGFVPPQDLLGPLVSDGSGFVSTWFGVPRHTALWSNWIAPPATAKNLRFVYEAAEEDWVFKPCPDAVTVGWNGRCAIQFAWFAKLEQSGAGYRVGFWNQKDLARIARFTIYFNV